MDFSDKELKVLLQALYRFRGEVSGASQSEQNKAVVVNSVIGKIEDKVGPIKSERTRFDREMDESLAILSTGKMRAPKLDNAVGAPKVKKTTAAKAAKSPGGAKAVAKKSSASKAGIAGKTGDAKTRSK
jgi:hypothetical protein